MFRKFIKSSLQVIAPASCLICNRSTLSGTLCKSCTPNAKIQNHAAGVYLWNYNEQIAKIISLAKYKPSPALCEKLGEIMGGAIIFWALERGFDLIVPIPPSKAHLTDRAFSHTGVIASGVSNETTIPISFRALRHVGTNRAQVGLSHDERLKNVATAFEADPKIVARQKILLIDDVITTGATAKAAYRSLIEAGAELVSVATLAKVIK
jgi:ComF family protein